MGVRAARHRGGRRQGPDERGSALVEFAFVAALLLTLVLGMAVLGILLYKRQSIVQAATEGARAGVGTRYSRVGNAYTRTADVKKAAFASAQRSLDAVGRSCGTLPADSTLDATPATTTSLNGTTCTFTVLDCDGSLVTSNDDCMEVVLAIDNVANPLAPRLPFLSFLTPDTVRSRATVRLGSCGVVVSGGSPATTRVDACT